MAPSLALPVDDLALSLAFYHGALAFPLTLHRPEADIAVVDLNGFPLLLAGPGAAAEPFLAAEHSFVRAGGTVHAYAPDLAVRRDELAARGIEASIIERWWGERRLLASDPDGYVVSFWTDFAPSRERALELLEQGSARLSAALRGLPEGALDRPLRPGQWSARQVVHHLADTTFASYAAVWQALAATGSTYHGAPFDQDRLAETLAYAGRPVEPSLGLTGALIGQLSSLIRALPGAWEREVPKPSGAPLAAGRLLSALASHLLEHVEEIEAGHEPPG